MLGDRIRNLRMQKNITQETLAKHFYISPQAVSRWEQNITLPDISAIVPLADFFGVTVDFLLRDERNPAIQDVYSLIEFKIKNLSGNSKVKYLYVKNVSDYTFKKLDFKIKFKSNNGSVVDYSERSVYDLEPNEQSTELVICRLGKAVSDYEIKIMSFSLA